MGTIFQQTVTSGMSALFVIGRGSYLPGNSVLSAQHVGDGANNLVITLPGSYTAVGLDVGSFENAPFTFTLSSGEMFTTPTQFSLSFIGVTSTTPLTSLTIDTTDIVINVDNFTFGQALAAAPEPASLTLLGLGSLGLLGYGWRRRKQLDA
jgi:hypothetical protein